MNTYDDGIVTIKQWRESLQSNQFTDMERYSNDFLYRNSDVTEEYGKKWVADPLHTWSRVWEYPYVATQIEKYMAARDDQMSVLDGGSGVTFFPYYLCQRYSIRSMLCVDNDKSFIPLHCRLAESAPTPVQFVLSDLAYMDLPDKSVDIIYCISVLEHLPDWKSVITEFSRVLRPGGILILTIDISLDSRHAILPEQAGRLFACVAESFAFTTVPIGDEIQRAVKRRDVFTLPSVWPKYDHLIPKRITRPSIGTALKSLLHLQLPRNPLPNLAIYGGFFVK